MASLIKQQTCQQQTCRGPHLGASLAVRCWQPRGGLAPGPGRNRSRAPSLLAQDTPAPREGGADARGLTLAPPAVAQKSGCDAQASPEHLQSEPRQRRSRPARVAGATRGAGRPHRVGRADRDHQWRCCQPARLTCAAPPAPELFPHPADTRPTAAVGRPEQL